MISEIEIDKFLKLQNNIPVIDVRSPSEFKKGHLPHAVNVALFSDTERADIGTTYKQVSKEKAYRLGLKYIKPKLQSLLKKTQHAAPSKKIAIYCWRGGYRSHAFAEYLQTNGFLQIYIISGGYKAFRNYVLKSFDKNIKLMVLGGFTGSGKTEILKLLDNKALQVIDLESLACHKGSAFGNIDQKPQPTVEQFENNLFWKWKNLDFSKPVWVEDEGHNIGKVKIPINLYYKMRSDTVIFLDIPKKERAQNLVKQYSEFDNKLLEESIIKIKKKLGDQNKKTALEMLKKNNYFEVAMIMLNYYDKYYMKGLSARDNRKVFTLKLKSTNTEENTKILLKYIEKIKL